LLPQSNHDVSTFSFKLTYKTKFQKKKRNTSEKIQRSWKEKDPISCSVSNERGIQGFQKIVEEWAAPFDLEST